MGRQGRTAEPGQDRTDEPGRAVGHHSTYGEDEAPLVQRPPLDALDAQQQLPYLREAG